MKTEKGGTQAQKKFDFTQPLPRPFLSSLPGKIDSYEEGVARFFQWRTGLDYYATIDQIVDFILNTRRERIVDLLGDTATFSLRLAGRKAFAGKIHCFDSNVTLLERARQRARQLNLSQTIEFGASNAGGWPVGDGFAQIAVSVFDFHRHKAEPFLRETYRMLAPEGYLVIGEVIESKGFRNQMARAWRQFHLRCIQRNSVEAQGVYYDREEMIALLFQAGFRQVVMQGLRSCSAPHQGVFHLIAATK